MVDVVAARMSAIRCSSEEGVRWPVGAVLMKHAKAWEDIGTNGWLLNQIRHGFKFALRTPHVPLSIMPPPARYHSPELLSLLDAEVASMLLKQAIYVVNPRTLRSVPGFWAHLFLVRKKGTDKWRPIIDLKKMNEFVVVPSMKMESLNSIRSVLRPGDFAASIDLQDAYFHIPIHKSRHRLLRFAHRGLVYQFRALPFGLSPAPWIFTQVMNRFREFLVQQGIRIVMYLDDWLILDQSRQVVRRNVAIILEWCARLGLSVNMEKSEFDPCQSFTFLGARFNTSLQTIMPTTPRLGELLAIAEKLLTPQRIAPAWVWQTWLGKLTSLEKLVPLGLCHMRETQRALKNQWRQCHHSPHSGVVVSLMVEKEIKWWLDQVNLYRSTSLVPPSHTTELYTDSSMVGWGAHLGSLVARGTWPLSVVGDHINVLEMRAVLEALQLWGPNLKGQCLMICTDNTSVMSYINCQGGTVSIQLCRLAVRLLLLADSWGIRLRARHIAGKKNVLADYLSRGHLTIPTEWTLNRGVFRDLCQRWGTPRVDLFAENQNAQLVSYMSPVPDPSALGVDAMTQSWNLGLCYAFPPKGLIKEILSKILRAEYQVELVLIAPRVPLANWWVGLQDLVIDQWDLPDVPDLLYQGRHIHQAPSLLHLVAFRLSRRP